MVKGARLSSIEFSKPRPPAEIKPAAELLISNCNNTIYESDDFRMYTFKIKRCNKTRSHDWTECPYLHRGEKARRRDPRKFRYYDIACPEFRRGGCPRGDSCEFAHGVFEFWLHPARYRTRPCTAGRCCRRKVCFFAHTPEQLRSSTGTERCRDSAVHRICLDRLENDDEIALVGDWDLELMKMGAGDELELTYFGDSPDIDWISELVS